MTAVTARRCASGSRCWPPVCGAVGTLRIERAEPIYVVTESIDDVNEEESFTFPVGKRLVFAVFLVDCKNVAKIPGIQTRFRAGISTDLL